MTTMTTMEEVPITTDDLHVNSERNSVEVAAEKFQELLEYIDQLESTRNLCELDIRRERQLVVCLLPALQSAYGLLNEITNYYGDRERRQYYDLRTRATDKVRHCFEEGDISEQQYARVLEILGAAASHRNGVAEGGIGA